MEKWLRRLSRLEIALIFLVIIAGSVVRMTGSGMGCPDWPKCFGHLIPPTERSQLDWQANTEFNKGQIIIRDEALYAAKERITSGASYDPANWEKYTKHDYAIFNPTHTWIEYINRLLGALSGIPMLIIFVISIVMIKRDWRLAALAAAGLFMLGFEAWLGKLVVDGNLIPGSITIHMLGALMIVAILLVFNGLITRSRFKPYRFTKYLIPALGLALVFTLIQIVLGTQVREQIDTLGQMGVARSDWADQLDLTFYIHRSFSLLILGLNAWLYWQNKRFGLGLWQLTWVMIVLLAEILLGIILAYLDMPAAAQPAHLLLGAILFALQMQLLVKFSLAPGTRVIPVS